MTLINRAADHGGATQGLYIPDHATDIIISEMSNCSVLQHIVNQNYDIDGLGLNTGAKKAHYTILTDIEVGDFNESQFNGEHWEPDDPFRSGEVTLCQHVKLQKKFSRDEAIAMCHRWELVQDGYESSIGNSMMRHTERYGLRMLVASANKFNTGNNAGTLSGNLRLGDTVNPVIIGKNNTSAIELLELMEQSLQETGLACGGNQLKVVANPAVFRHIRGEQSRLGAGCCLKDNPAITGMIHPVLGMEIYSTLNMPRYRRADGKWVNYVLMVDPNHIAAPVSLDYIEWQTILNDIYLVGNYRFDVAALSNKSIAVAAVVTED